MTTAARYTYTVPAAGRWDALHVALAFTMLTYVWRIQDLFPALATIRALAIATGASVALFLLDPRALAGTRAVLRHSLARLLLVLVLFGVLSVPGSLWPGLSAEFMLKNLLPTTCLALMVASATFTMGDARRFAAVQVAGATLYAGVVLARYDVGESGRLGNLVNYDANDLGMLLVCTLPLALFFARYARTLVMRAFALGIIGVYLLTIIKTGSRGAFLGLMAVLLCLLVQARSVAVWRRLVVVGAVALLVVAGGSSRYWESMRTLLNPTADYNWVGQEEGGRMNVWTRGVGYMMRYPVTGVGLAAFPVAEGTISSLAERQQYGRGVKWSAAHNSFVQAGAELGVGGLLAFVLLLGFAWGTARHLSRDALAAASMPASAAPAVDATIAPLADAYVAAIVGYAVAGFFLSQAYGPYLHMVVGTLMGLDLAARRP